MVVFFGVSFENFAVSRQLLGVLGISWVGKKIENRRW